MRKHVLGAALVAAVALAACGGDSDNTAGGGSSEDSGATTLSMVDNAFTPMSLTVASGTTVDVSNDGQALHNIAVEGADIDEDVEPGQSTSITVDLEAGDYTMFCEYHRTAGMEGTLTVS